MSYIKKALSEKLSVLLLIILQKLKRYLLISEDCVYHIDEMDLQKSFQFHNGDFVRADKKRLLGGRYNARNKKTPSFIQRSFRNST